MKNQVMKLAAAMIILLGTDASAQQFIKGQEGMYPSFVTYKKENSPAFNRGRIEVQDADGKTLTTKQVKLVKEETDEQNITPGLHQDQNRGQAEGYGIDDQRADAGAAPTQAHAEPEPEDEPKGQDEKPG